VWYVHTTDHAPKGRIIAIDLARPARENWREIVPEQKDAIDVAVMIEGRLVVAYMKDAASALRVFGLDGKLAKDVPLPGVGSVVFQPSHATDRELFFGFTSFTAPRVMYRLDGATLATTVVRQSKLTFDPAQYETERVFYASKDGTRIPMSLVHRKGLVRNGSTPTILTGYGGFNISALPGFGPTTVAWAEMGGMFAFANLRGGGEYGEEWHEAGKRAKKQNVFDDFIAAAEWLIANRYTSTPKLAIFGGSNGGLLIGAVLNQRPDLFGAAMPAVGVMDMLRFQKFTVGAAWTDEYGSSENADDFRVLGAYSPLHNIKAGGKYPAVLITTSDHDDRVVPGHSFKYAATLQASQVADRPVLIRIETRGGHGAGLPIAKVIEESADRLAFLYKEPITTIASSTTKPARGAGCAMNTPKIAFLICPIGEEGSAPNKRSKRLLREIVAPTLKEFGFTTESFLDPDPAGHDRIRVRMFDRIRTAPVCIADLTGNNPNVFFEYGLRRATGQPVLALHEKGHELLFDVDDFPTYSYDLDRPEAARREILKFLVAHGFGDPQLKINADRSDQTLEIKEYIKRNRPARIDVLHLSGYTLARDLLEAVSGPDITIRLLLMHPEEAARYWLGSAHTKHVKTTEELVQSKLLGAAPPTMGLWYYRHEPSVAALMLDDKLVQLGWYLREPNDRSEIIVRSYTEPAVWAEGKYAETVYPKVRAHFDAVWKYAEPAPEDCFGGRGKEQLLSEWNRLRARQLIQTKD
jgi:hypothetical protein